jgi:hypothetical protein
MKTIIWILIAVIVVVAAYLLIGGNLKSPTGEPSGSLDIQPGSDTTTAIENDLNAIDTGDLDAELKDIDAQLNDL